MTLEKVEALPPITRSGSGRNSDIFTEELLNDLRNDTDTWAIVYKSDWISEEEDIKKVRLHTYMKGRYAQKKNPDIETTVRTEKNQDDSKRRLRSF